MNKHNRKKLDTNFGIWNSRNLTLFGRCIITKTLGVSQLIHPMSSLDILKQYVQAVNSSIYLEK